MAHRYICKSPSLITPVRSRHTAALLLPTSPATAVFSSTMPHRVMFLSESLATRSGFVSTHSDLWRPHRNSLVTCRWSWDHCSPPKPPIPPDPPPASRPKLTANLTTNNTVNLTMNNSTNHISSSSPFGTTELSNGASTYSIVNHHIQAETPTTTTLPGYRTVRPPAFIDRYGNRATNLVLGDWSRKTLRFWCISVAHASPFLQQPPANISAVDLLARSNVCSPSKGSSSRTWASSNIMGFNCLVDLLLIDFLKSFRTSKLIRPSTSTKPSKSYRLDPYGTIRSQGYATHRSTFSMVLAEAIALKAALEAASHLEFQHFIVYLDSQSLVSLLIFKSDVNELRSVLVDINCLRESFASISICFISRTANVLADFIAESDLLSLSHECITT